MAKANLKTMLAEKGERYAVYAAGGLMLLLMILGIMNMSNSGLPDGKTGEDYIKDADQKIAQINSAMNGKGEAPPLPPWVSNPPVNQVVHAGPSSNLFFDPILPPDTRRINPLVLPVQDIQASFMHAKILALDIQDREDGTQYIGVVVHKPGKNETVDKEATTNFLKDLQKRKMYKPAPKRKQPPAGGAGMIGGPMGMIGGPMGGMIGGPMGGLTPPSGVAGGPMGGLTPPSGVAGGPAPGGGKLGMPPGGIMGGMMAPATAGGPGLGGYTPIETGERLGVEYVPLDPEKLEGKRFAWTIYPQRMVIVYAAFPYKAQVEEVQKALRLDKPAAVFSTPDAAPHFRGFVIERQVLRPDGKVDEPWKVLDVESHYRETIYPRKVADKEEDPALQYVTLHEDHELTMPLPMLLSGKYPDVKLPSILATIQKQQSLNKPPAATKGPSQLKGEGNIFRRTNATAPSTVGQPPTGEGGFNFPKINKSGTGTGTEMGKDGTSQSVNFADIPESVLVRVLDNDIAPGRLYQYRLRVKMQNPNWVGKKDDKGKPEKASKEELVSRPSDAHVEIIEGPPVEMKGHVSVPREDFLFAIDPPLDAKDPKKPAVALKPGEGLLQVQRWLPAATVGNYKEPVADWIVADVVVRKGHYMGGKQFVNLPIWDSTYNKYILRTPVADKALGKKDVPKHGVMMDPTKPGPTFVVVDVRGGVTEERTASRIVTEESANEVLLLDESGNLQVRSAVIDRLDPERAKREEAWKEWIEKTEKDTAQLVPQNNPMPKGPNFD